MVDGSPSDPIMYSPFDDPSIFGSAETFVMDNLQRLLEGGRGFDTIK